MSLALLGAGPSSPSTAPVLSFTTGLLRRYEADQITPVANGTALASWPDLSSNNDPAVQATSANKPTYATSGPGSMPAVDFSGSQWMTFTQLADQAAWTIFAVYRADDVASVAANYFLSGTACGVGAGGSALSGYFAFDGSSLRTADEKPTGSWNVMTFQSTKLFKNGTEAAYGTTATVGTMTALRALGARADNTALTFDGKAFAFLVYGADLSRANCQIVERYLGAKTGITVA